MKGFERVTQGFTEGVGDGTEVQHIDPFLSRSPGQLNHILSPTHWTSCALSYIIVRRPPSTCGHHKSYTFNPSTVKIIFWYSSTGCTCYLHMCISYFDSPAGSEVNVQHKTKLVYKSLDEAVEVRNRMNNRSWTVLWFTSPYNMVTTYKMGKEFLHY